MAQILNNTYEIQDFIGSGGMSTVFRARHIRLGIDVAVKSVRKSQTVNLLAEVNILTKLNHPNLVRVIDIFEDDKLLYIVMDYVEGENLQSVVDRVKVVPEYQVLDWFRTMADALRYLHTRKPPIIYRDMKPANIILQKDGSLKLIDFGIAREYKPSSSGDTTYVGTNGFAAPEQFGLAQTDARTDIYSLGMTMYYLATGKSPLSPPYGYTPARKINPQLSAKMERILEKCIRDNPEDRYQNAKELLLDLFDGVMPAGFGYLTTGSLADADPDTGGSADAPEDKRDSDLPETKLLPAKKPGSGRKNILIAAAAALLAVLIGGYFGFHIYTEPTCTEPAVCKICGKQFVPALGHSWEAATADRPETCSRCGATRGEAVQETADPAEETDLTQTVSITEFIPNSDSITIRWSDFPGAEKYRIYRETEESSADLLNETTVTEYTDYGANKNGARYKYWITAVVNGQETDKSKDRTHIFLDCSPRTGARVLEDNTLKVAWVVNEQADGYQIRLIQGSQIRLINPTDVIDIEVDGEKQQYTLIEGLDGTYTVETRCYKMLKETHYSAWSEAKEVTIPG